MRFVLASASPRRRDLLDAAGIGFDVHPVDVDEARLGNEAPATYVERVATLKATAGLAACPDRIVLAADTTVVIDQEVLGKPANDADAARMLRLLAGRAHEVLTGVAVARPGEIRAVVERTLVWMAQLADAAIHDYVASGEPAGKAGAYAIQGRASRFITKINGSYTNVVGLPVATAVRLLGSWGLEDLDGGRRVFLADV